MKTRHARAIRFGIREARGQYTIGTLIFGRYKPIHYNKLSKRAYERTLDRLAVAFDSMFPEEHKLYYAMAYEGLDKPEVRAALRDMEHVAVQRAWKTGVL